MSVALVTGATGLVGSHIVDQLLADGWRVRALARNADQARAELPAAVEIAPGDILDEASFVHAAAGADTVFHTAATILGKGGYDAYRIPNVEGTRNAIAAAERAKARLLQLSSVAVYGPTARYDAARRGEKTHEGTPLLPLAERAYYARSKRESEDLVMKAHREGRIWATAVRPDVIYGTRDRTFVPRMARLIRGAFIPLLRGGRSTLAIVHVTNVARGAVLAATNDAAGGKAYNLANDFDVSVREFFELAGRGLGRRPRFVPMPVPVARGAIRGIRTVGRWLTGGVFNFISTSTIDFISEDNPFSSDLARHELGWRPTIRPQDGVPEAFRWWREHERARQTAAPG